MSTQDNCCTIVPYFNVHDGKAKEFRALCDELVNLTGDEAGCLYYGFSFNGNQVHCREGYANAEGLLEHVQTKGALMQKAMTIADLTRLEVHGPKHELDKLREPLAPLNPEFWELEYGFRN